ncbi:MAG: hypothetical protein ABIN93_12620 [Ginsengibacter sp.]
MALKEKERFETALSGMFIYFPLKKCFQKNKHYDVISDFDNVISYSKVDANSYFGRNQLKKIITDYEGSLSELEKAIKLCQIPTKLNEEYDDEMR